MPIYRFIAYRDLTAARSIIDIVERVDFRCCVMVKVEIFGAYLDLITFRRPPKLAMLEQHEDVFLTRLAYFKCYLSVTISKRFLSRTRRGCGAYRDRFTVGWHFNGRRRVHGFGHVLFFSCHRGRSVRTQLETVGCWLSISFVVAKYRVGRVCERW